MADRGRVLQLSTMVPPARHGGAERVVQAFAEQLRAAGFEVRNSGLNPRGEGDAPIPNLYWPFDGRRRGVVARMAWHAIDALTPAGRRAAERAIDAVDPQVVITHNLRGWGLAPWTVAHRRGIPLIHVVHDYGLLCNTSTLWHDGGPCGTACKLRAARSIARWPGGLLVGVSEAVLGEHRRHGFGLSDPSAVIHPVAAAAGVATATSSRPGTGDATPSTFGYLGRLAIEKGIGRLIDAIAATEATLIVAGEGEQSTVEELKAHAPQQVQWWGWADPAQLFDAIDVLVVPSLWREPYGLVVVEAARAGVPVLIADQPGLVEAARSCGARYRPFSVDDAAALPTALRAPLDTYRADPIHPPEVDIVDLVSERVTAARP